MRILALHRQQVSPSRSRPTRSSADLAEMRPTQSFGGAAVLRELLPSRQRLRERLGQNLRLASAGSTCGGAPFCRWRCSTPSGRRGSSIHQGYGLTETSSVIFDEDRRHREPARHRRPTARQRGHPHRRGRRDLDVRVARHGSATGNIPESRSRTAGCSTGDLSGRIEADGYLAITGRKKELDRAVERQERGSESDRGSAELALVPAIEQAVVVGDGRPYLTALVVCRAGDVRRGVGEEFVVDGSRKLLADVAPWERIRKIAIVAGSRSRPLAAR